MNNVLKTEHMKQVGQYILGLTRLVDFFLSPDGKRVFLCVCYKCSSNKVVVVVMTVVDKDGRSGGRGDDNGG